MTRHRSPWRSRLVAVLVVLAFVAAACGGDDTAAPDSSEPAATDETTADTTAEDEAEDEAAEPEGDEPAGLAEAREIVARFTEPPDAIPVSEPIDADIPTGRTMYFITCGVEICELYEPILQAAVDTLEWNLEIISTDGSPESVANAWDQVVRDQPDAVLYTGTPRSQVEAQMTQAAANGTEIAGCCVVDEPDDVLDAVVGNAANTGALGEVMAAWVIADAADAGNPAPGTLYVDLPDFPILSELSGLYAESLSRLCPDCEQELLEVGLAGLGDMADQVVSALRANPALKYVVMSTDSISVGLPAAIAAAGIEDVQVFGEGPALATLQEVVAGERPGTMGFAAWEILFSMVDAIARIEAGVPPIDDYGRTNVILTADNIESTSELSPIVADVVEQFAALWGKG